MAIEIVEFPIKNGDFPLQTVSSPEGKRNIARIVVTAATTVRVFAGLPDLLQGASKKQRMIPLWSSWFQRISSTKPTYPLVNIQKAMENHHFSPEGIDLTWFDGWFEPIGWF